MTSIIATTALTSTLASQSAAFSGSIYGTSGTPTVSSATTAAADLKVATAAAADSGSYSFAVVAQNARTVLTANEQQIGVSQPNDYTTGAQWNEIFGNMDRRSLYSVASNQGGQFTSAEQGGAQQAMDSQVTAVLGNVGSMTNESDVMNAYGKLITFMNNVSPEEKGSLGWAYGMASLKTSYNDFASDLGTPQQEADAANPLEKVFMAAMAAAQSNAATDKSDAEPTTLQGIFSQPWAQGWQSQILSAYRSTVSQGAALNVAA